MLNFIKMYFYEIKPYEKNYRPLLMSGESIFECNYCSEEFESLPPPPPAYQSIVDVLKEENISIHIERGSGMISMTRMFQTHGDKKPQVYTRTKRFKDMKKALEKQLNSADCVWT